MYLLSRNTDHTLIKHETKETGGPVPEFEGVPNFYCGFTDRCETKGVKYCWGRQGEFSR